MAKKRGRPPKTPSSASKKDDTGSVGDTGTPSKVDFSQLDDEDLHDIDNLSPKQAELWIQKIDALRAKIKEKATDTGNKVSVTNDVGSHLEVGESSNPNLDKAMTNQVSQ
ncbi:hypothetical protein RIF29_24932 [Crotalaria pallida]|uniref:Uncharacterized protein n=1 Tax=Crotalaria pallida TaxID=3830 RepID=A0AAN9HX17_CROPI